MRKFLIVIISIFLISLGFLAYDFSQRNKAVKRVYQLDKTTLFSLIQDWREDQGFPKYIEDSYLCEVAEARVNENPTNHEGLYEKYDYSEYPLVENISWNSTSEKSSLNWWLRSKPHREALEADYKYTCVATKDNYAVQIFSNLGE